MYRLFAIRFSATPAIFLVEGFVAFFHRGVRDFRGAMQERADKGLFITTGNFTKEAIKEVTRDRTPTIDLIDGEQLYNKLKELNLGVKTELIEEVSMNSEWFKKI